MIDSTYLLKAVAHLNYYTPPQIVNYIKIMVILGNPEFKTNKNSFTSCQKMKP